MTRPLLQAGLLLAVVTALAACPPVGGSVDDDDALELDFDGDGWPESEDCDDSDPSIHPERVETCETPWDDDCDGDPNSPGAELCTDWYPDADGDGAGDDLGVVCICTYEEPWVLTEGGDCDDTDPEVGPFGLERDNGVDDDCDGQLDEGVLHAEDIQPIWSWNCLLCHIEGGYGGGLVLVDGWGWLVGQPSLQVDGMDLVVPGDPEASYLWYKLNGTQEAVGGWGESMPFDTFLTEAELAFVQAWIAGGALQ